MAQIRSAGNRSTELRLRGALISHGIRGWCVQPKGIFGKPDFTFPEKRVAIFVDSCYWHGCKHHQRKPASNLEYWNMKFDRNRKRDAECGLVLKSQGWKVMRIWEHELEAMPKVLKRLQTLLAATPESKLL